MQTQQVSCDGTLEYFYIPQVPKMNFGARNQPEPTNQISHHSVFWQKPFKQQESQDKEEQNDGLDWKWTLKFFDLIFRPSTPSRQKVNVTFLLYQSWFRTFDLSWPSIWGKTSQVQSTYSSWNHKIFGNTLRRLRESWPFRHIEKRVIFFDWFWAEIFLQIIDSGISHRFLC
jgi:hypothetical protein